MSNSFRPRSGVRTFLAVVIAAVAAVVVTAAMTSTAHAEDVHICSTVKVNAGKLYDAVDKTPEGGDLGVIAESIMASDVPEGQKQVLLQGLLFLAGNWGHPSVNRAYFVQVAADVCQANFGQIGDRNNT